MKPALGLLALLGAATASMTAVAQFGPLGAGQLAPGTSNVQFGMVAQGTTQTSNLSGMFVFSDPTSWSSYWAANHGGVAPNLGAGFFNNWRLVAIHSGIKPDQGYGLGVTRIVRRIDRATISAIEVTPAPSRSRHHTPSPSAPWIVLRVEKGAFGFDLQTQRVQGSGLVQSGGGGSSVQIGGATVTFGPGY